MELIIDLPDNMIKSWLRFLPPDDAADFIQVLSEERRLVALSLLDDQTRRDVLGLMAYAEDAAGGLMNTEYVRLRPEMSVHLGRCNGANNLFFSGKHLPIRCTSLVF